MLGGNFDLQNGHTFAKFTHPLNTIQWDKKTYPLSEKITIHEIRNQIFLGRIIEMTTHSESLDVGNMACLWIFK